MLRKSWRRCRNQRGLIGVDETDNIVTDKLKEVLDEQLIDRRVGPGL